MKTMIIAAALALAGSSLGVRAEGPSDGDAAGGKATDIAKDKADLAKDVQDVRSDLKQMQTLDAKHVDDVQALNAKEKAAMQAVKSDATLTPEQKKEKLAALRTDFNAQRRALNETFRADKRKIQGRPEERPRRYPQGQARPSGRPAGHASGRASREKRQAREAREKREE